MCKSTELSAYLSSTMNPDSLLQRITITPGKRSGKPGIRGTRITVSDILGYMAGGMTETEILEDFPQLEADDIRAALAFAAHRDELTL